MDFLSILGIVVKVALAIGVVFIGGFLVLAFVAAMADTHQRAQVVAARTPKAPMSRFDKWYWIAFACVIAAGGVASAFK